MQGLWRYPQNYIVRANRLGWKVSTGGYLLIFIVSFGLGITIGLYLNSIVIGTMLGIFLSYVIPTELLEQIERRRRREVNEALIDAIRGIQNIYAVSYSIRQAVEMTLPTMKEPAREAFEQVLAIERTGKSLDVAFEVLKDYFPMKEINFFIYCVSIIQQTGGKNGILLLERSIKTLETAIELDNELEMSIASRVIESRYLFGLFIVMLLFFQYVGQFSFKIPLLQGNTMLISGLLFLNMIAWVYNKRLIKSTRNKVV